MHTRNKPIKKFSFLSLINCYSEEKIQLFPYFAVWQNDCGRVYELWAFYLQCMLESIHTYISNRQQGKCSTCYAHCEHHSSFLLVGSLAFLYVCCFRAFLHIFWYNFILMYDRFTCVHSDALYSMLLFRTNEWILYICKWKEEAQRNYNSFRLLMFHLLHVCICMHIDTVSTILSNFPFLAIFK